MINTIKLGDIYIAKDRSRGKDLRNRIYEVISVTITHVYIRNIRTRYSWNVSLETLRKDYIHNKSQEKHTL